MRHLRRYDQESRQMQAPSRNVTNTSGDRPPEHCWEEILHCSQQACQKARLPSSHHRQNRCRQSPHWQLRPTRASASQQGSAAMDACFLRTARMHAKNAPTYLPLYSHWNWGTKLGSLMSQFRPTAIELHADADHDHSLLDLSPCASVRMPG